MAPQLDDAMQLQTHARSFIKPPPPLANNPAAASLDHHHHHHPIPKTNVSFMFQFMLYPVFYALWD
jgi:hypothetical protein